LRKLRGNSIGREVRTIRRSLSSIGTALGRVLSALGQANTVDSNRVARPTRKLRLSPARRAALKLQGQYMGYIRTLKPRAKAQVRAARERKGVQAAIVLAKRLAKA
jgi:hypothetical protein